jgi:hypothetical protein
LRPVRGLLPAFIEWRRIRLYFAAW